jgi:branched-chain amino acid transport system permease protein
MTRHRIAALGALLAALALPSILQALGADFYLGTASRIAVYAIAATSLNLLLGYGGMISLGHAAFFGLGAYSTGILLSEGVQSGLVHVMALVVVVGAAALVIGAISLRTRGVYFIMITLAFAQMLFYLGNSIKGYGGDEGLTVRVRSLLPGGVDLRDRNSLYYTAVVVLALELFLLHRFVRSRFGLLVHGIRDDEVRAEALGVPVFRAKLAIFVAASVLCGLAGALSVNLQGYVSPNTLHWTQSGTLLVMVILGGVGTLWGGVLGAAALLLMQEVLSSQTQYWEFWIGWVLLAVVLFTRSGIVGILRSLAARATGRALP